MTDFTVPLSSDQRKRLAIPHDNFGSRTALLTRADLPGACGIHATMRDMMRFAKAQLTPPGGKLGEAIELAWKQHNGSNTMWYALFAFIPEKNMVVAVTLNDGDRLNVEAAAWYIVNASAKR